MLASGVLENHLPISIEIEDLTPSKVKSIKMYNKLDRTIVNSIMRTRNEKKATSTKEIDDKINKTHDMLKTIDEFIPTKTIPIKNMRLNKSTRALIKDRRRLLNLIKKNKNNCILKSKELKN